MARSPKITTPVVHIVLDTNIIFTELADKLVTDEISDFITKQAPSLGLQVIWHLSDLVIKERRFQMIERGVRLLTPLSKLEDLLGHKLNMTSEIVEMRVEEAINRNIKQHNFDVLQIDFSKIDWEALVIKATSKKAPFSSGQTEKGFKDALILESFDQLARSLPRSPRNCRIALLSSDDLLRDAARERVASLQNVYIVNDLQELKTMLNSVAAHLEKSDIDSIISKASAIFFETTNQDGLYYKWNIGTKIRSDLGSIIFQPPEAEFKVSTKRTLISRPTFLKKESQKLIFSSIISYELEAAKTVSMQPQPSVQSGSDIGLAGALFHINPNSISAQPPQNKLTGLSGLAPLGSQLYGLSNQIPPKPRTETFETIHKNGVQRVEVKWSLLLNRNGNLVSPSLVSVEHSSGQWTD